MPKETEQKPKPKPRPKPQSPNISRRNFLKTAGALSLGVMGVVGLKSGIANAETIGRTATDVSSPSVARHLGLCIGCGNCVRVCKDVQKIGVYKLYADPDQLGGRQWYANTEGEKPLAETPCINCGQCTKVCPVGALTERDSLAEAREVLAHPESYTVVWQIAPSVQNMLGEAFALPAGTDVSLKIAGAMKQLGGYAFHTDFAADVTIMEEGSELLRRLRLAGELPMLTSCCPGWVKYMEMHYPDLLPHLSTTKSPQQIFGALAKHYFPERYQVPRERIFQIAIMPCTAKKFECSRPEMADEAGRHVDLVLTAREFTALLQENQIDLRASADGEYDILMRESSGAARIFGASGGVMEAALRAVSLLMTGHDLPDAPGTMRSREGVKEASLLIAGQVFNFAAVNGIGNIRPVMEAVRAGNSPYHFIEVMACPHGCLGGGGALSQDVEAPWAAEALSRRQQGLYRSDVLLRNRDCLQNTELKNLYADFLGQPGGHLAEELLHTFYTARG